MLWFFLKKNLREYLHYLIEREKQNIIILKKQV